MPKDVHSHELLREIVRLDFWRILSRLRSVHAQRSRKTANKPALTTQLSAAVNSPLFRKSSKASADKQTALRKRVQRIQESVAALEALAEADSGLRKTQDVLMEILERISEVANDETLARMVNAIGDLSSEMKRHLVSAVGKLGRYYSASRDLIRAVRIRRYSIFNKISVEECQLPPPPEAYLLKTPSTLQSSINDLIQRDPTLKHRRLSFSVKNYLGKSYLTKSENFEFRTSSSLVSNKVHAEIQLLFFYELHGAEMPPRMICASKSPCYLCHLFFDLHGQFHVPETHGRLYPGWILPTWLNQLSDERQTSIGRMIDILHTTLVLRIQHLVTKKRIPFSNPNESVLWTTANWSASSLQSPSTKDMSQVSIAPQGTLREMDASAGDLEVNEVSMKHRGSPSPSLSRDQPLLPPVSANQLSSPQSESGVSLTATCFRLLRPGDTANMHLADAAMKLRIETKWLNLTFTKDSLSESDPETCWIRCTLLDRSELRRSELSLPHVDVMSIAPGSEVSFEEGSLHAATDLLIIACDQIVSIKYSAMETPSTMRISF